MRGDLRRCVGCLDHGLAARCVRLEANCAATATSAAATAATAAPASANPAAATLTAAAAAPAMPCTAAALPAAALSAAAVLLEPRVHSEVSHELVRKHLLLVISHIAMSGRQLVSHALVDASTSLARSAPTPGRVETNACEA